MLHTVYTDFFGKRKTKRQQTLIDCNSRRLFSIETCYPFRLFTLTFHKNKNKNRIKFPVEPINTLCNCLLFLMADGCRVIHCNVELAIKICGCHYAIIIRIKRIRRRDDSQQEIRIEIVNSPFVTSSSPTPSFDPSPIATRRTHLT